MRLVIVDDPGDLPGGKEYGFIADEKEGYKEVGWKETAPRRAVGRRGKKQRGGRNCRDITRKAS